MIKIRQELPSDHKQVHNIIEKAFAELSVSDHNEQFLVERLRKSKAFIPELSLVAEKDGKVVGHILLTRVKIKRGEKIFNSLSLAPVSVIPTYQRQGIGSMLITNAHKVAKNLGFKSVLLVGHENYYPRFGYVPADKFGIKFPFDAPKANCMTVELIENGLDGVSGTVEFPKEFFE